MYNCEAKLKQINMTGRHDKPTELPGLENNERTSVHADELSFGHIELAIMRLRRATKLDENVEAALERFFDALEVDYGMDFAPKDTKEHLSPEAQAAWSQVEDAVKEANIKRNAAKKESDS
jgi:hypothetical protein